MDKSNEYQSLRQEIIDTFNREVSITTFGFTATAAILGYGFTVKNPFVFLVPLLVLTIIIVQLNNSIYAIQTIAVYIRTHIESKDTGLNWETTLYALRNYFRKQKPRNPIMQFSETTYASGVIAMGLICILLSVSYGANWIEYLITFLISIIWLSICIRLFKQIKRANSGLYEKELEIAYKKVTSTKKQ